MATYVVGDIQGCYKALAKLLDKIRFDQAADRLWLVGDLVNRGPASDKVLRLVKGLGDRAVTVLGNHDLYLLMVAAGFSPRGRDDTLDTVLRAKDRDELLEWLRQQPLAHAENGFLMVHAGVPPTWDVAMTLARSREVEAALVGPQYQEFLLDLRGDEPHRWASDLKGNRRLRFIVNALVRMRFCTANGDLSLRAKGPPSKTPAGLVPWYKLPHAAWRSHTVLCGHWSALGLHRGDGIIALDTGYVWGGRLSAVRLEDGALFQVSH